MASTQKLTGYRIVAPTGIVPQKFQDSGECPQFRIGTSFLLVGDRLGADTDKSCHVLLE